MPSRVRPDPIAQMVGARIKDTYRSMGLNLQQAAGQVGMAKGHLSNIVHGKTIMTIRTLYQIATALGVPPGALLPDAPLDQTVATGDGASP